MIGHAFRTAGHPASSILGRMKAQDRTGHPQDTTERDHAWSSSGPGGILRSGAPAPQFTLHSTPDQTVSLSDFRGGSR
jgi:hypothetical protein